MQYLMQEDGSVTFTSVPTCRVSVCRQNLPTAVASVAVKMAKKALYAYSDGKDGAIWRAWQPGTSSGA
jgi:hypothetical protein